MTRRKFSQLGLHVIAKPIGPICNLKCAYCFYLEKQSLYPPDETWRMSDRTLETFVRQYIEAQPEGVDQISFAFQGGEPTLMGIDFFTHVVELQKTYAPPGVKVSNTIQTNGVLLDDRWCEFFKENGFLVGLSADGPADLHDKYRVDQEGRGTYERVMQALRTLRKHGVDFNVLICLNRHNAGHPRQIYKFLRDRDIKYAQFIPIVEPLGSGQLSHHEENTPPENLVSERSVRPKQYGRFMIGIFDQWIRRDVGRVFIRDFDEALAAWAGADVGLCTYAKQCGRAVALEHNGDLYSCDHFVSHGHKLGNIHDRPIAELANRPEQEDFGRRKSAALPACCRECDFLFVCNGGCPKDRLIETPDGQAGLNYLCSGMKMFFSHIAPHMKAMALQL